MFDAERKPQLPLAFCCTMGSRCNLAEVLELIELCQCVEMGKRMSFHTP